MNFCESLYVFGCGGDYVDHGDHGARGDHGDHGDHGARGDYDYGNYGGPQNYDDSVDYDGDHYDENALDSDYHETFFFGLPCSFLRSVSEVSSSKSES